MSLPSGKKLLLFGFIAVLLIVIPLTVYLVQQQQKTQSSAQKSTTLGFNPASKAVASGDTVSLDVMMNPGANQVSFLKLIINYDPTKLEATASGTTICPAKPSDALCPNALVFPSVLQGPTTTAGTISVTLSIGQNTQNIITTATKIATISFKVIATSPGTTDVTIDDTQTLAQALSTDPTDKFNQNVLASVNKATITITAAPVLNCTLAANPPTIKSTSQGTGNTSSLLADCPGENATDLQTNTYEWSTACGALSSTGPGGTKDNTLTAPQTGGVTCKVSVDVCNSNYTACSSPTTDVVIEPDPSASPTPTPTPSAAPTPTPSSTPNPQAPVCQSLTLNAAATGTVPYPLTFIATGTSSASTISKVTFNFGDSAIQDVPQANSPTSVSVQTSHTYSSTGTFTATSSLTDALGNVSDTASCTQTIVVNAAAIAQATPTPSPLPPTGPDGKILTIGAIGTILSILGILLFFAL